MLNLVTWRIAEMHIADLQQQACRWRFVRAARAGRRGRLVP